MRDDRERLLDIRDAIEKIGRYASRGKPAFEEDELLQTWIMHHLEIIGEAARSLSSDLRNRCPGAPWAKKIGMRNILVHHYFGIDSAAVWTVVEHDLPDLRRKIEAILRELQG